MLFNLHLEVHVKILHAFHWLWWLEYLVSQIISEGFLLTKLDPRHVLENFCYSCGLP